MRTLTPRPAALLAAALITFLGAAPSPGYEIKAKRTNTTTGPVFGQRVELYNPATVTVNSVGQIAASPESAYNTFSTRTVNKATTTVLLYSRTEGVPVNAT